MSEHRFRVQASWQGQLDGHGEITAGGLHAEFSVPEELKGPGRGSNPEELIVAACASCYLITLSVALGKKKLAYRELAVSSEGVFSFDRGLRVTHIVHHPRVILSAGALPEQREAALEAAHDAERQCMVSQAMAGNVAISVSPNVVIDSEPQKRTRSKWEPLGLLPIYTDDYHG